MITLVGEKTFTTHQIARICNVYPTTVISWIKRNKIKAFTTPGGHRRVLKEDLLRFLQQFRFPVPTSLRAARKRVLVVEDEQAIGQLLCRALQKYSKELEITWIRDGIGALLALGDQPPDLLVLDVVMPVVDGARVLCSLRNDPKTRHIKVIGITGKRLPPEKMRFMKKHTNAFFLKPFDVMKFAETTGSLLGIQAPVSP